MFVVDDLFHLQLNIGVDLVFAEDTAFQQEFVVGFQRFQRLTE